MSEARYLEARNNRLVSKGVRGKIVRAAGDVKDTWRNSPEFRNYVAGAGTLAASSAATGAALSYQGGHLRENAHRQYERGSQALNQQVESAARRKDFKSVGGGVYAKPRKFFRGTSDEYIKETVRANRGTGKKTYVETKYPRAGLLGATYYHSDDPHAYVVAHTRLRDTPKNRLRAAYTATHEQKHVTDFAGTGKQKEGMNRAINSAQSRFPKGKNFAQEYLTGRALRRQLHYVNSMTAHVGHGEGRADTAAAARHKIPAYSVSGYPMIARGNEHFGRGYVKGGGQYLPEDAKLLRQGKKEFKARAKSEYGKKRVA